MTRRLLNLLTALSLLLCVAVCVLWMRSYWVGNQTGWVEQAPQGALTRCRHATVGAGAGVVILGLQQHNFSAPPAPTRWFWEVHGPSAPAQLYGINEPWWGFGCRATASPTSPGLKPARAWAVTFPFWLPVSLLAGLPAWRGYRRLRRRRYSAGLCPQCGYDLRATPGRCPECGHMPMSAAI